MLNERFWLISVAAGWWVWAGYWWWSSSGTAKTQYRESISQRATHLVPLALSFALLFADPVHFPILHRVLWPDALWLRFAGLLLDFTGIGFSIWARSHLGKYWSGTITLKEGHRLIRSGPYRFVRHPIYTGMLSGFLGGALAIGRGRAFLGFVIVTIAFVIKLKREERALASRFGEEYQAFLQEVPALIPFLI